MHRILVGIILTSLLLVACGVDTTGLSAASSRMPMGQEAAPVLVEDFSDFQCPGCKSAHELISKPLVQLYPGIVRVAFRHFPLQGTHRYSLETSQAAECAADQGKFWEFIDLAFREQEKVNSEAIRQWGDTLSLNADLFDRCIRSGIKKETVLADFAEGEQRGVNATPSYFVNGVKVPATTLENLTIAVDEAMKQLQQVPL